MWQKMKRKQHVNSHDSATLGEQASLEIFFGAISHSDFLLVYCARANPPSRPASPPPIHQTAFYAGQKWKYAGKLIKHQQFVGVVFLSHRQAPRWQPNHIIVVPTPSPYRMNVKLGRIVQFKSLLKTNLG